MRQRIMGGIGFVFGITLFLMGSPAFAGSEHNLAGWAWGGGVDANPPGYGGIGWISVNSLNCDVDGNGKLDVLCGGDNSTQNVINYGVNMPESGDMSGYAWNEYYGWISFHASDVVGCPSGGNCTPRREGDELLGWARILAIPAGGSNSGGWSGWISLNKKNTNVGGDYGVKVSNIGREVTNLIAPKTYAWSDELGWIDFSIIGFQNRLKICDGIIERRTPGGPNVSLPSGAQTTLSAKYGTGDCASDPLVSAAWNAPGTPEDAVSISGSPAQTVTVTANSVTGVSARSEDITAAYDGKTAAARVDVSCNARTCAYYSANASAYCPSESRSFDDNCGGTINCIGTKSCAVNDYNWKEIAP